MGVLGKVVFVVWLVWVHLFFYRNLLARYHEGLRDIGLGGISSRVITILNGILSSVGLA